MAQASLNQRVKDAFLELIESLKGPFPQPSVLAAMLAEKEPVLAREFLVAAWSRSVQDILRARSAPAPDLQMVFGFRLDEELELKQGRVAFVDAQIPDLEQRIRQLTEEADAQKAVAAEKIQRRIDDEIGRLKELIAEMQARRPEHESLTVGELQAMRDAGAAPVDRLPRLRPLRAQRPAQTKSAMPRAKLRRRKSAKSKAAK